MKINISALSDEDLKYIREFIITDIFDTSANYAIKRRKNVLGNDIIYVVLVKVPTLHSWQHDYIVVIYSIEYDGLVERFGFELLESESVFVLEYPTELLML